MFFDAPTQGFDPESKQRFIDTVKTMKGHKAKTTVIVSTLDIEEAALMADRICIMSQGKVIDIGTPAALRTKHGAGYNLIIEDLSQETGRAKFDEILTSSLIENISLNQDLSTGNKTVYSIPYDQGDHRISSLLRKFEALCDCNVAIEPSTFEDAYVRALKSS